LTRSPEDVAKLFAYGRWANALVLDSAALLTPEEFTRQIGGSFGSVQGTLAHLYGADWVWLERFHGRSPRAMPETDVTALATLRARWEEVEEGLRAFAAGLTPERIAQPLSYVSFKGDPFKYPLGETLTHLANHGTYHRGQVATLMRQLGKSPVATDYSRYLAVLAESGQ
jgi:uncharacterized damage-inducible protein DinB